jgi:hypothetical protein
VNPSTIISGWERVALAIDKVRDRLRRVVTALETFGIPYAIIGGNAVAEWVGRVDASVVRYTQDVDLLLKRADLPAAQAALAPSGFIYRQSGGIHMFLDGTAAKARDAVHVIFAGEKVRADYVSAAPDLTESEPGIQFQVISLVALIRMKLTSFRDKDRMHLRDLISVGQVDANWLNRLDPELALRLRELLENPEG